MSDRQSFFFFLSPQEMKIEVLAELWLFQLCPTLISCFKQKYIKTLEAKLHLSRHFKLYSGYFLFLSLYTKLAKLNKYFYFFCFIQHKTGLPISTYFSAVKLRWMMDNVEKVHEAVLSHRAMFGTVDSWLIWVRAVALRFLFCISIVFVYMFFLSLMVKEEISAWLRSNPRFLNCLK